MKSQSGATRSHLRSGYAAEISDVYFEGIVAGVIGAATVAVWFFILDVLDNRPFYTPTVLGTALFRRGANAEAFEVLASSFEMAAMYTWVHGLAFCVIGGLAAKLLAVAERNRNLGFGILLLFVVFEFGLVAVLFILAEPVLHALAWPAILMGNLFAGATMASYFWWRHPNLIINP
jgi:hypothetical protein